MIKDQNYTGRKILLVEDNKLNQLIAKKFLQNQGFEISVTENGSEAVSFKMEIQSIIHPGGGVGHVGFPGALPTTRFGAVQAGLATIAVEKSHPDRSGGPKISFAAADGTA